MFTSQSGEWTLGCKCLSWPALLDTGLEALGGAVWGTPLLLRWIGNWDRYILWRMGLRAHPLWLGTPLRDLVEGAIMWHAQSRAASLISPVGGKGNRSVAGTWMAPTSIATPGFLFPPAGRLGEGFIT